MKCRLCACTRGHEWCCTSDGPQHRLWPTLATCLSVWAPHFRLDIIVHIFLSNVTQLQPSCINMLVKGILQLSFDMKPLHPRCLAARNRPGTQYMLSMHCVIHVHERWNTYMRDGDVLNYLRMDSEWPWFQISSLFVSFSTSYNILIIVTFRLALLLTAHRRNSHEAPQQHVYRHVIAA